MLPPARRRRLDRGRPPLPRGRGPAHPAAGVRRHARGRAAAGRAALRPRRAPRPDAPRRCDGAWTRWRPRRPRATSRACASEPAGSGSHRGKRGHARGGGGAGRARRRARPERADHRAARPGSTAGSAWPTASPTCATCRPAEDPRVVLTAVLAIAAQSRPHPHGRGLQPGDPPAADLDRRVAPARGDLTGARSGWSTCALHRQPLAAMFGPGTSSSSDGQHFPVGGPGESVGAVNARHGFRPAVSFYAHVSDRYAVFHDRGSCRPPPARRRTPPVACSTTTACTLDVAVHHDLRRRRERPRVRPRPPCWASCSRRASPTSATGASTPSKAAPGRAGPRSPPSSAPASTPS